MRIPKILNTISESSICYFQSSINYTYLLLESGETIISGYNIKVFEKLFQNNNFIKINRSNIVNVAFIQKALVEKNNYMIRLTNGDEIVIARRRVGRLKKDYPALF